MSDLFTTKWMFGNLAIWILSGVISYLITTWVIALRRRRELASRARARREFVRRQQAQQ